MAKISVMKDLRIEIEPPYGVGTWLPDMESKARAYERWAREFEDFVRDHRSQDAVRLTVMRDMRDECSHCGYEWEADETGPLCCSAAQEEHAAKLSATTE